MLRLAGAGCLAAMLPKDSDARADGDNSAGRQANDAAKVAASNLMHTAHRTAANSDSLDESYFWHDGRTLLILRRAPGKTVFRAVLVDARTGWQTFPQAFNDKNSPLMEGGRRRVTFEGSPRWEMQYLPPTAAMSPNGKWLLWSSGVSLPGIKQWVASTLNGQQQKWPLGPDPDSEFAALPGNALRVPDSHHWVELVSRYAKRVYSIHLAHVYVLDKAAPVRTVHISGLGDGLPVGIRQDGTIVMHTSSRQSDRLVQQLVMSLVSLDADTVTARKLRLPIPASSGVSDVKLSPKGDRLAWILEQGRGLTRLYTLYAADADGAHSRPLGSAEMVKTGKGYSWPRDLRWLPDGKQVSFVYKNAIYTHPV